MELPLDFYKDLVEESIDLLSILSLTGEILFESAAVKSVLGYDEGELIGKNAFTLIRPEHSPGILALVPEALLHPEKNYRFEVPYKHKNGTWIWLECSARIRELPQFGKCILLHSRDITDRKSITDNILKLQKAINASSEAIFITNTDGIITYINAAFTHIFGYEAQEVVGKVTPRIIKSGLIPQEGYAQFWEKILKKQEIRGEIVNKSKDGRLLTLYGSSNAIEDDTGKIIGFVSIQRDITQEKASKKSLDEINKRLELLTESLNIGVFSSLPGEKGHFTAVNSSMISLFEASGEKEMLSHNVSDFYRYPEKRQKYAEKVLDQGYLKNEKIEFVTCKGKNFIGNASAILKKLDDGTVLFEGIIEDVTNAIQNELRLQKISYAVEQSPDSIVITDKDGTIEYVNPFFTQNTGYTLEEAKGQNPRILKSGETSPEVYAELWNTISSGNIWRGELKNKKKNGDTYWESISISPVKNSSGEITNYVAVKKDISKEKIAEEELKKRTEELERMNKLMIGRELKMRELKDEIKRLSEEKKEDGI